MNSLLTIYNLNFSEKIIQQIFTHVENRISLHILVHEKEQQFQRAVGPDHPAILACVFISSTDFLLTSMGSPSK